MSILALVIIAALAVLVVVLLLTVVRLKTQADFLSERVEDLKDDLAESIPVQSVPTMMQLSPAAIQALGASIAREFGKPGRN